MLQSRQPNVVDSSRKRQLFSWQTWRIISPAAAVTSKILTHGSMFVLRFNVRTYSFCVMHLVYVSLSQ